MRRVVAVALLGILIGLTGCLGGGIDQEALAENETYDWERTADVTFNVTGGSFHAIHSVENGSVVTAYRETEFQGEQAVSISAVQFRYENGTVVGADLIDVEQSGGRTLIRPPDGTGQLAYTARSRPKDFRIGLNRSGSYEVILPPSMRIGVPFMGMISPGGAELTVTNGRTHLYWDSLDGGSIDLHYYLERDFWIFAGLVGTGILGGIAVVIYFRVQIRQLRRRIEGSDLEIER
jgi:hypothetical protein